MLQHIKSKDIPFLLITFLVPLVLFKITSSSSLMFDDAAEFAVVIKLGSIAHPPGTPAFILTGMSWTKITSLFGMSMIASLNLLASVCISLSAVLLFIIFTAIGSRLNVPSTYRIVSCGTALAFATAATTWAWANTIEVYSFQVLAMAIALFGLVSWQLTEKRNAIIVAAIGISLGLGNHHITMIAFLPFTVLFFMPGLLIPDATIAEKKTDKKKKVKPTSDSFFSSVSNVFRNKNFGLLVLLTTIFTLSFYAWMFIRAQNDYPFMFGQPDTLSDLFYHMRGGSYAKNLSSASTDIISSRLPYFLKLTVVQLFLILPFFLLGIAYLVARKLSKLMWMVVIYFLILFVYQLNNNQWSSTDAYMLLPFMSLYIIAFYAIVTHINKFKLQYVIPVIVVAQIAFNFKDHDRRSYPVSGSLMELLDKSAPKNSVIMISDWSTVIQYYYYRIVENFRPDLVVLNYDIKFTHYKILPELYPEYYKKIKPEYDHFIDELGKENPHQVKNTGCDLSTNVLLTAFKTTIAKMEEIAKKESTYFLTDPHAHYFYAQQNIYDGRRFVSGGFSSSMPGDSTANDYFINFKLPFLESPLLFKDPAALDKLVDFQAMLDRHIDFYKVNNYANRLAKAEAAKSRVMRLQREMKKSMAFAYKIK